MLLLLLRVPGVGRTDGRVVWRWLAARGLFDRETANGRRKVNQKWGVGLPLANSQWSGWVSGAGLTYAQLTRAAG